MDTDSLLELLGHCRKNPDDLDSLSKLLTRTLPDIRIFVAARIPPADADDVVQEILIGLVKSISQIRAEGEKEFFSYLYVVARAAVARFYAKKGRDISKGLRAEAFREWEERIKDSGSQRTDDEREALEAIEMLRKADPECAELLVETHLLGMGYEEVAKLREVTYDAIRMRVNRCLEKINFD
jgi:RNA polymerase sigma factor (sigma-70 family)